MIKTIDHIGIMTNDLKRSLEFYTEVLGFSYSTKIEIEEFSAVFVEKDGCKIELMSFGTIPKRSVGVELNVGESSIPVNDHISFSVDNIEVTAAEFKEKGVVFDMEPVQLEGGMKLASFKDPDGVLIELVEHPR